MLPVLCFAEPVELDRLTEGYEGAVERAVGPLNKTYIEELEKLKDSYTRASRLEDAIKVDTLLKEFRGEIEASSKDTNVFEDDEALEDFLVENTWSQMRSDGSSAGGISFGRDGDVFGSGTKPGWTWEVKDLQLKITFKDGNSVLYDFSKGVPSSILGEKKSDGSKAFIAPIE